MMSVKYLVMMSLLLTGGFAPIHVGAPKLYLSPVPVLVNNVGDTIPIQLRIDDVVGLWSWNTQISWDNRVLKFLNVTEGTFLEDSRTLFQSLLSADSSGIEVSCNRFVQDGKSGNGLLATFYFKVLSNTNESPVTIVDGLLLATKNEAGGHPEIPHNTENTRVVSSSQTPVEAVAGVDKSVTQGTTVVFDGSSSKGEGLSYSWTLMDGTEKTLQGVKSEYKFDKPGNYTVTLRITDKSGYEATDTLVVTVQPLAPTPFWMDLMNLTIIVISAVIVCAAAFLMIRRKNKNE